MGSVNTTTRLARSSAKSIPTSRVTQAPKRTFDTAISNANSLDIISGNRRSGASMFARLPPIINSMRALFVLAFLFSFLAPIRSMAQIVPMQAQAHAGDVLQANRSWGEKMNTKGATLRIKEVSRKGNVIAAQFYAEGLPKKWIYSLMAYPGGSAYASFLLTGFTLAPDGRAICSGRPGEC